MISKFLKFIFGVSGTVDRALYLKLGAGLSFLKVAAEHIVGWAMFGKYFSPFGLFIPMYYRFVLDQEFGLDFYGRNPSNSFWIFLYILSVPFAWVALTLSIRRLIDAGKNPWLGFFLFIPVLNILLIWYLCFLPSRSGEEGAEKPKILKDFSEASSTIVVSGLALIAFVYVIYTVFGVEVYSSSLFFSGPFVVGIFAGLYSEDLRAGIRRALIAQLVVASMLLLLAVEGLICLTMAAVPALICSSLGAWLGFNLRSYAKLANSSPLVLLLAFTVAPVAEKVFLPATVKSVVSKVEVDAPPEVVWNYVVAFPELPPTKHILFKLGVAAPTAATIEGSGVGAVRHCNFTTGSFVEPITVWDPPKRLAFDVEYQPETMKELTPYKHIHAPHLDGFFKSVKGEFRLVSQGDKTILEGETWYEMRIFPVWYWDMFAGRFVSIIHNRVLEHVKNVSESR